MIIFSSLHYGIAFNIIGQFFLALILTDTVDNRNISKLKKIILIYLNRFIFFISVKLIFNY